MNKYRKILSKNLREEMYRAHVSKAELCRRAEISRTSLDDYLSGDKSIGLDMIERLAGVLEVAPWRLLMDGNDDPSHDIEDCYNAIGRALKLMPPT